jgi:hypothetical protein
LRIFRHSSSREDISHRTQHSPASHNQQKTSLTRVEPTHQRAIVRGAVSWILRSKLIRMMSKKCDDNWFDTKNSICHVHLLGNSRNKFLSCVWTEYQHPILKTGSICISKKKYFLIFFMCAMNFFFFLQFYFMYFVVLLFKTLSPIFRRNFLWNGCFLSRKRCWRTLLRQNPKQPAENQSKIIENLKFSRIDGTWEIYKKEPEQ